MSISKGFLRGHRCDGAGTADSALRRRLLGIGLGGAAVSLLPFLVGRASATTPTTGPIRHPPAGTRRPPHRRSDPPTTTSPCSASPKSVEIAAFKLYEVALGTDDFDEQRSRRARHDPRRPSGVRRRRCRASSVAMPRKRSIRCTTQCKSSFSGDRSSVLDAAYTLESTAVATHTDVLAAAGHRRRGADRLDPHRRGTPRHRDRLPQRVDRSRRVARRHRSRRADAGGRVRP